jgi:hypothetical protein
MRTNDDYVVNIKNKNDFNIWVEIVPYERYDDEDYYRPINENVRLLKPNEQTTYHLQKNEMWTLWQTYNIEPTEWSWDSIFLKNKYQVYELSEDI